VQNMMRVGDVKKQVNKWCVTICVCAGRKRLSSQPKWRDGCWGM